MTVTKNLSLILLVSGLTINASIAQDHQLTTVKPSLQTVILSGFTRARESMPIASEVAGRVTHIYADIGQPIPSNGHFACLDDTFINLDIATTKNSISQLGVNLRFLSKQVERHKKLVNTKSAAISLYDDLLRQKDNAYYEIQRAKIKKQKLLETKRRHCINAPKHWQVTQRAIEVGQWIDLGTTIAQAGNYKELLIPLTLTAEQLAALQKKQDSFTIYLPEYKQEISASIERISPAFDEQSHKIRVDLLIQDTLRFHRGGIRVELSLDIADKLNTYLISRKAVDERFEEAWLIRANGQKIRVMLLENLSDTIAKVSSSEIKMGDKFKLLQP